MPPGEASGVFPSPMLLMPLPSPREESEAEKQTGMQTVLDAVEKTILKVILEAEPGKLKRALQRYMSQDEYWELYSQLLGWVDLSELPEFMFEDMVLEILHASGGPDEITKVDRACKVASARMRAARQVFSTMQAFGQTRPKLPQTNVVRLLTSMRMHPTVKQIILDAYLGELAAMALLSAVSTHKSFLKPIGRELVNLWLDGETRYLGLLWALGAPRTDVGFEVPVLDTEELAQEMADARRGRQQMVEDARASGLKVFPGIDGDS